MELDAMLGLLACQPNAPLDLAEVALTLARDEYPDLDTEAYLNSLAGMAHEAKPRLCGSLEARVRGLCHYLFHDMGFRGNAKNYYDARNSYLNDVLERRTGIPIALAVVAMSVGTRAGLQIEGVGLPGHFVTKVVDGNEEVLFDPFHGGRLLNPDDCERLVQQIAGTPFEANRRTLHGVALGQIVQRMLANLKGVYLRDGDFARAARVTQRLCRLCPNDLTQRRDLGAALLQNGRPGQAINHFSVYLESKPQDSPAVRLMLDQARGAVARWN